MAHEISLTANSPFSAVAKELRRTIDAALVPLREISDAAAGRPYSPEKWTSKEVIGHLIDSAANNHQRFVRAQEGPLTFPPYAQDHWVKSQRYNDRSWEDLIGLWYGYNRHLAHVIEHIPEDRRNVPCTVESDKPVTLGFLASDYIVHLRHHLTEVVGD